MAYSRSPRFTRGTEPGHGRAPRDPASGQVEPADSLAGVACPNPECALFNRFDAGNLSVVERTGSRKRRRGRKKHPGLKPPPGLLAGVVHKVRDGSGDVVKVRAGALFGRLREVKERIGELGIGTTVNTSHLERLNATMRCQQARLARRPRCVSRDESRLQWSLWLWRDLYNWVRVHGSLEGRTPAMATGMSERVWSVPEYDRHPVHADDLTRAIWAEERADALTSALDSRKPRKVMPAS